MRRSVAWIVVFGGLSSGCAAMTVKGLFREDASCPSDRIVVTQDGVIGPAREDFALPPPPEIANDPERLEIYEETARERPLRGLGDEDHRLFRAEGCGLSHEYACDYQNGRWRYCKRVSP
jgi:hypothetical protein